MKKAQLMIAVVTLLGIASQTVSAFPNTSVHSLSKASAKTDWSVAVVDSTIKRNPDRRLVERLGLCESALFYGQYLVYCVRKTRYLEHIKSWVDHSHRRSGEINRANQFPGLHQPGNLLLILYKETKQEKYKLAAETFAKFSIPIRGRKTAVSGMPTSRVARGSCGPTESLWRSVSGALREMFGDDRYANAEVVKQMLIYYRHLNDPATGLLWHAYDESGANRGPIRRRISPPFIGAGPLAGMQ